MLSDVTFPDGMVLGSADCRALAAEHEKGLPENRRKLAELIDGFISEIERLREGVYLNAPNLHVRLHGWFGVDRVVDFPDTTAERALMDAREAWRAGGRAEADRPIEAEDTYRSCFGVCDTLEQALDYLKPFVEDPAREFLVAVQYVQRHPENAGTRGGWRWHKWGPYIGTHEIQCEYLDDEEGIDRVMLFHTYEILPRLVQTSDLPT